MSDTIFYGTGRRKRSVARVYMTPGKGEIKVNGQFYRDYLCRDTLAKIVMLTAAHCRTSWHVAATHVMVDAIIPAELACCLQLVACYCSLWPAVTCSL